MDKALILIDDHALLREGIASWIQNNSDWKVVAQAGTYEQVQQIISDFNTPREYECVIAIVDISFRVEGEMYDKDYGFEIIRQLNECSTKISSIVFSSHESGGYVESAFSTQVGARGYVGKTADEKILLEAIETVARGETFIQHELVPKLLTVKDILSAFTKKEKLVASLIRMENTNAEIAEQLGISQRTVENYITRLYDKTGAENRVELLEKLGRN